MPFAPRLGDRKLSERARRRLVAIGVSTWLVFLIGGAVVGYLLAGSYNRFGTTLFGVAVGAMAYFVLTWAVIIFVGTKRDKRAQGSEQLP